MNAQDLTRQLKGSWCGAYGAAPCPCCQPERRTDQRALSVRDRDDGKGLLLYCFKEGCSYNELVRALRCRGITEAQPAQWPRDERQVTQTRTKDSSAATGNEARAKLIWREAQPITGTLAETYLRGRQITCDLPDTLRFHGACPHPSGFCYPAMVGLVEGSKGFGIHRTFLLSNGSWKADVEPNKAMLGPVAGGAVRLNVAPAGSGAPLIVTEGIETGLSFSSGLRDGPFEIWAALSAPGLQALDLFDREPGRLIVGADGDPSGDKAARALETRAKAQGWRVLILPAPKDRDWNDILMLKGRT